MKTIIILSSLGIVSMLAEMFRFKQVLWYLILAGLAGALAVTVGDWNIPPSQQLFGDLPEVMQMIVFNNFAVGFSALIITLVLIWFLTAHNQYKTGEFNLADHFSLILFSSVGAILLVSFNHFSTLFMGIEILSIPLYILAGSMKKDLSSNEASLKYFMLGAFTTGILLFGMTLVYGAAGTFNISEIGAFAQQNQGQIPVMFYSGLLLLLIALAFKVSAVPFHFWTPDVYQGSPVMITAFMATVVKTAAFAGFFRLFSASFSELMPSWSFILMAITAITILAGNILAVYQTSVKRMLAYSGVSQAGYLLMTILVLNDSTRLTLWIYTASYSLATLGAFGVLYYVIKAKGNDSFESFNSLGKKHPLLALVMTVCMLSLAGIPPTLGFFAKFYLFSNVLKAGDQYLWIVIVAVIGSLISVYYYFRLIIGMYAKEGEESVIEISSLYKAILVIITGLIIIMGLTPGLLVLENFNI